MQAIKQHKEKMRPPATPPQKKTQRTPGRIKRNN